MAQILVYIGRRSGPCNDLEACAQFEASELEAVKTVLKMVNEASNNKEGWYMSVEERITTRPEVPS